MIETWLLVFLVVYIHNKFVINLNNKGIFIYQKYNTKALFKNWAIYPPLVMLGVYIIVEIMIFCDNYWIVQYGNLIKQITLLTYLGLIIQYQLYNSMYQKYKGKGIIGFLTSPVVLAFVCLFFGYFLNYLAVQANLGHMPVFPSNTYFTGYTDVESFTKDGFYVLGDQNSKVIPLCDSIDIYYSNLSIGDLFVRAYIFIILFFSIRTTK